MEILQKFGFEPALFIGQIINFLIIFYLFQRFLYKPLLKLMEERNKKIKFGLEAGEKAQQIIDKANLDKDDLLKRASRESENILEEAKKLAEKNKDEILDSANIQATKIIENSRKEAKFEEENILKNLKILTLETAKKMLTAILPNLFNENEQKTVLDRATKILTEKN